MNHSLNPRIYVLTFTSFVMLSSEFIVAGLLPQIAASLQITVGSAGALVTAFALGMGIGAPLIAAFTHKVSMRALLIWACVALFLGNTICAMTSYFPILLAGRALGGVGVAIFWTNATVAAAALSTANTQSLAISRVLIGISIASVVGVPLGKWVSDAWTWEYAMGLMAGLSALALVLVIGWVRPPEGDRAQVQENLLGRLSVIWKRDIALALLSYLLMFAGIMTVFSFLATLLTRYTGFPAAQVTLVLALYGVADIVGNLLLARRVPNPLDGMFKRVLLTLAVSVIGVSVFGASLWLVPLFVAAAGFCHAGASMMNGMDVIRRAGADAKIVNSVNVAAINVGIMLGAMCGGLVTDHVGIQYVGYLAGVFVLLAWAIRMQLQPVRAVE